MTTQSDFRAACIAGQVESVRRRERTRLVRHAGLSAAARTAAGALRDRYGDHVAVFLFGSVLDPSRFRLDSDLDLAVQGIPPGRWYEAVALAEAAARAAGAQRLDLVSLDDAADWLAAEIHARGERIA